MKNLDREEYQLVYDALKNYSVYMDSDQKKLSEQILDFLYYPRKIEDREENDKTGEDFRNDLFDDIVKDAEEALANESKITQEEVDASLATPMWYEKEDNDNNEIKSLNFRS